MGRIRSIKPEFPQSETIGALSRDARLLFIMLWTIVDDEGRARASSRMLASILYPYDDDAGSLIDGWLDELEHHGCVRRYTVDGSKYLDIPHWAKHQKIDHKSISRLPAFEEASEILANPREPSRALAPDLGPRTEDRIKKDIRAVASATRPDRFEDFWKVYPKRDGANPKAPARKKFLAALKAGADSDEIIAAVGRYAEECRNKGQLGSCYVAQAMTWLGQQRWGDYEPQTQDSEHSVGFHAEPDSDELVAWEEYRMATEGKSWPRDKLGGWTFPTRWPPGYVPSGEQESEPNTTH